MSVGGVPELWAAIKEIPGAVKAIARLLTGVGNLGVAQVDIWKAKLEQKAQTIRDDTSAKSIISGEMARVAALVAAIDEERVERGLIRWLGEEDRKQANREEIARLTIENLNEEPPPKDTRGPDDDWMNQYSRFSEDVSTEKFQRIWAKVLAGEIRKPGSFSLRALHFLSILDEKLAEAVLAVAGVVLQVT